MPPLYILILRPGAVFMIIQYKYIQTCWAEKNSRLVTRTALYSAGPVRTVS